MTMDVIYEERRSDWSHQVSAVATTRWLQCDQALCLSAKSVACETKEIQHSNQTSINTFFLPPFLFQ